MNYKSFVVLSTDNFEPENFSIITDELLLIKEQTAALSTFEASIIISFMKDHSLKNNWIKEYPRLTGMVTSGTLSIGNTEALFDACRDNLKFRSSLEKYIKGVIEDSH